MGNLIIGFVLGIAACTVGFSTMAEKADQGVRSIQKVVREVSKESRPSRPVPPEREAPIADLPLYGR
jgi:hypothetical protein